MRNRTVVALLVAVLAVPVVYAASSANATTPQSDASAKAAEAQEREGRRTRRGLRGHRRHRLLGARIMRQLELTDDQKAQLKSLREAERARVQPFRQQLRESRKALREATAGGQFDEARVRAIAESATLAQIELEVSKARQKAAFFSVLTPEQRAKIDEMRKTRLERHGERRKQL